MKVANDGCGAVQQLLPFRDGRFRTDPGFKGRARVVRCTAYHACIRLRKFGDLLADAGVEDGQALATTDRAFFPPMRFDTSSGYAGMFRWVLDVSLAPAIATPLLWIAT